MTTLTKMATNKITTVYKTKKLILILKLGDEKTSKTARKEIHKIARLGSSKEPKSRIDQESIEKLYC